MTRRSTTIRPFRPTRPTRLAGALAALALVGLVGCGDDAASTAADDGSATTTAAPDTTAADAPGTAGALRFVDSDLGRILADGDGNVLYLFTADSGTTSNCGAGCIDNWPAVPGPATGDGIDAGELGTTTRDDGTTQATFAGHPVYRFAGDAKPGDTNGQGLGGKWYVIGEDGNAVGASDGGGGSPSTTASSGY